MTKNNKYEPGDWWRLYPILIVLIVWKKFFDLTKKIKNVFL
jgi:hypothetical protein